MEPITTNTIIATVLAVLSPMIGPDKKIDENQLKCLADNVYFESATESRQGKRAVAHVTINRSLNSEYPESICDVVKQGVVDGRKDCQFSWMCDGKPDDIPLIAKNGDVNELAYKAYYQSVEESIFAMLKVTGDNTQGATHYYAHDLVTPKWSKATDMVTLVSIEHHTFMTTVKDHKTYLASAEPSQPSYVVNVSYNH